ncbi:MAG TPA: TlpA disulfide reductase family protein [Polyangiaceae bacterium]
MPSVRASRLEFFLPVSFVSLAISMVPVGCGRRLDPSERNTIAKTSSASARTVSGSPKSSPNEQTEIRHVDSTELFAAIRRLGGKGVVLNVWASWCGPCEEELPMLQNMAKSYASRGITVLPLSVDDPETEPQAVAALRKVGFPPPYYVAKAPIEAIKQALWPGWPGNVPVTFLFDGAGARRYFFNAEVYEKELTPKLDALIAGTLAPGKSEFGVAPGLEL